MFRKKENTKRQTRPAGSLAQYGIFDVPETLDDTGNNFMNDNDDDDDDDDLEAELAALTAGDDNEKSRRTASRKPVSKENLDAMVAESMRDINLEEEMSDGDDDPELLSELKMITGEETSESVSPDKEGNLVAESTEQPETQNDNENIIKLLRERLQLYEIAEKKAKETSELSRARRFNRGIKTLKELLSNAQAGKFINESDIPPELPPQATAETTAEVPSKTESTVETNNTVVTDTTTSIENNTVEEPAPTKSIDEEALKLLKDRQQEYKVAAIAWKRAGNMKEALQYLNIAKHFDIVITAVNAGETVDLSDMPASPNLPGSSTATPSSEKPEKTESETQGKSSTDSTLAEVKPPSSENLGTALKERLEACKKIKTTAENEGNSSKARRYGRICKQFEDAIKLHARGKPVPIDELPTIPGFEPLSVPSQSVPDPPVEKNETPSDSILPTQESKSPEDKLSSDSKAPVPPPRAQTGKKQNQKTSRAEKQLALLQHRQHELKQAALNAKKEGDIELARTFLRQAKGLDQLIEASKAGLPVDMNSIPLSPRAKTELNANSIIGLLDDSFTVIDTEDCSEKVTGTDEEIYENLESQLMKQIKWCLCTRDHCKALGDVSGYNKWERLALNYKRDLDMLIVRKRDALSPPQHHYEIRTHTIVQSCTDLSDSDIEISIIRGVNYSKDADTYVIFEFPYPSDSPPSDRTSTIKGACNPEYDAVFSLSGIDRSSRQCQRAFKRHALKCQVWAKGGFFRSDSLLGTVTVKLQPLETQCELHDSFPLMDGRKPTGGKLELKIRLRNPILTKQIENITDKWLIIDY
ncbi:coiled-coil and C2 domain-containing protein 1-like isoform X5 [Frieseomelitta varia]|uniref:coiled-coil and C2 domain-containing protein 1-like isoform X5 n=1 Tax=Frieseomelitta varia TaxID=561572 RepID=UPI001CB6AAE2|nr:coiled-coil and C2 domain-containing protein 1-like isoform X5 [Frieseomelitta varia]